MADAVIEIEIDALPLQLNKGCFVFLFYVVAVVVVFLCCLRGLRHFILRCTSRASY